MTIADKILRAKDDYDAVYEAGYEKGKTEGGDSEEAYNEGFEAGKKSEYDAFWDGFQDNGNRTDYDRAFVNWGGVEYIKPKYMIAPTAATTYLFSRCTNLKGIDGSKFDFSGLPENYNVNASGAIYALFNQCTSLEYFPDIGIPATVSYGYFCYNCTNLVTVEKFRVTKDSKFDGSFYNCRKLVNLTVEGEIGQNGLTFANSPKLSDASITSVIRALSDSTSGLTVSFRTDAVIAAFTTEEWNALVATKPNWTISLV